MDFSGEASAKCVDEEKKSLLEACLSHTVVSLWELRELALSKGGLLNGKSR